MTFNVRRSIKARLGAGFGVNLALVCVLGAAALAALWQATSNTDRIYRQNLAGVSTIGRMNLQLAALQSDIKIALNSAPRAANVRELPKHTAAFEDHMDGAWSRYYPALTATDEEARLAGKARADYARLKSALAIFGERMAVGQLLGAASFYGMSLRRPLEQLAARLHTLHDMQLQSAAASYQTASASAKRSQIAIAAVLALVLAVTIAITLGLTRTVTRPLRRARDLVDAIGEGRLDNTVINPYRDEFGSMLEALSRMQARLADTVHGVRDTSQRVSRGSQQIAAGNDELSRRTQEQAANLEETAASMEQMTAIVKQNADNAGQADRLAREVKTQAGEGGVVVERAVAAMAAIDESSREISDILSLIDDIAFQTNLLALNASVEAARAGEQGRGFAVVATEVRNLASRSAKAASEIKTLVADSATKVADGSKHVAASGQTLAAIVASVSQVSDIVAGIAAASGEQSSGIEQVNHAVSQMDSMTQRNAGLVEQAATASRTLESHARALTEQVAFFRLADAFSVGSVDAVESSGVAAMPAAETGSAEPTTPRAAALLRSPRHDRSEGEDEAEWATF